MKSSTALRTSNTRRAFSSTTFVTVLVFTSLLRGALTQTPPGVPLPFTDPQPKSYFDVLTNAYSQTRDFHLIRNSSFASMLENSVLDFHRLGYENVVANFLSGVYLAKDKSPSRSRPDTSQSPDSVDADTFFGVADFLRESLDKNEYNMSTRCVDDLTRILIGIVDRDKWVIPFVDSTGKPGPSITKLRLNLVGNYKQCREARAPPMPETGSDEFQGNYCVLKAAVSVVSFTPFQIGICAPSTCSTTDLTILVYNALQIANLTSMLKTIPADCHTDEREATTATVFAIIFASIIGLLMLGGSAYDLLVIQRPKWIDQFSVSEKPLAWPVASQINGDGGEGQGHSESTPLLPKKTETKTPLPREISRHCQFLLAFSVYTNASKVLSTKQAPGSLSAIHGIRFLSMSWVLLGHSYAFSLGIVANADDFPAALSRWSFDVISNAYSSVDTFFALSGLLTAYLTIKHMKMKASWKINWPLFYFHRFWRLTPPYMLVLLLFLGLQRYLGSGALWNTLQPTDKESCEENWWTNLLYVNNVVKQKEMCFGHTWYLANDMQFFWVSPLMLIPFFFHPLAGYASCLLFLLVTWIYTGVMSTIRHWPVTTLSAQPNKGADFFGTFFDYYEVPWCRIGPYVIGIMAGYVLAVTQGGRQLRMKWWVVLSGWLIAVATGLAVVYGIDGDISGDHPSSVGAAALYNATSRSAWGAAVCWVIVACASGYGGPVNKLLSWSPFVVLGKLTYMAYLIHPSLLTIMYLNRESLLFANDTNMIINYLGVLLFTNMTAFVLMLALESPWIGLEKIFIRKERTD